MRDDYLNLALKVVIDPNLLVNLVSRRVKQLRRGGRPLIESLKNCHSKTWRYVRFTKARSPGKSPTRSTERIRKRAVGCGLVVVCSGSNSATFPR